MWKIVKIMLEFCDNILKLVGKMWKYAKNMLKKCVTFRFIKKIM